MILNLLFTLAVLFPSMSIAFALTEHDVDGADEPVRGGTSQSALVAS